MNKVIESLSWLKKQYAIDLTIICEGPERQRLQAARKYIVDNGLTWKVTVERYLDIYQPAVTAGAKN